MKTTINNSDLHFEHKQWESELAFWNDELKTFNDRLGELAARWTDKDVLKKLEHYQNEFILHGNVIEDLQEAIEKHELNIANHESSLDIKMTKTHLDVRNEMEAERQIYIDLKKEFFKFLSKYM